MLWQQSKNALHRQQCFFSLILLFTLYAISCLTALPNVARWLSPKSAEWYHKKLLDAAKNLVANFQLKSAKSI